MGRTRTQQLSWHACRTADCSWMRQRRISSGPGESEENIVELPLDKACDFPAAARQAEARLGAGGGRQQ